MQQDLCFPMSLLKKLTDQRQLRYTFFRLGDYVSSIKRSSSSPLYTTYMNVFFQTFFPKVAYQAIKSVYN